MIAPMITTDPAKQAVLRRMHRSSKVENRHLVMPLDDYRQAQTFTESNELFIEAATALAEEAVNTALAASGIDATEVDFILFTSVTGVSAPSIDALLVPRLGLRPDVKRIPMFGLGCVAGAAGIGRLHDYLLGHPNEVAVLVSVELCSLTVQKGDDSMANLVASGLFGDGAAAVVMVGDEKAKTLGAKGFDVVDTRSRLYADTHEFLGFNPGESGFRIVLTAGISDVIDEHFDADMTGFLGDNGLTVGDIDDWIAHPGGPKVLDSFSDSLGLPEGALELSWSSLARVGNLSSASVLHVLADTLERGAQAEGDLAVVFALGPGICAELVLLRWAEDSEAPGGAVEGTPSSSR
jgi:alkylresorcinol/alkylpyrone synthase